MMSYQSFFVFAAGAVLLLLGLYILIFGRNGSYHVGSVNVSKYIVLGCITFGTMLAYYAAMMRPPKDHPPSHQSIKNAISVQSHVKVDRSRGSEFRPSVEDGWVYYGHRQNNGKWLERFFNVNNPQVGDIVSSTQPANLRSEPPGYFLLTGWTLPSKIGVVLPSVHYTIRETKEVDGGYYWVRVERND